MFCMVSISLQVLVPVGSTLRSSFFLSHAKTVAGREKRIVRPRAGSSSICSQEGQGSCLFHSHFLSPSQSHGQAWWRCGGKDRRPETILGPGLWGEGNHKTLETKLQSIQSVSLPPHRCPYVVKGPFLSNSEVSWIHFLNTYWTLTNCYMFPIVSDCIGCNFKGHKLKEKSAEVLGSYPPGISIHTEGPSCFPWYFLLSYLLWCQISDGFFT